MPYYLAMGMTADEYWYGSPMLLSAYRTAYNIRLEQQNQQAWLQGLYIYNAVGAVVSSALGGKGKNTKYADKPIELNTEKTPLQKRLEKERANQKVINQMNAWAAAWNKRKKAAAESITREDGDNGG